MWIFFAVLMFAPVSKLIYDHLDDMRYGVTDLIQSAVHENVLTGLSIFLN